MPDLLLVHDFPPLGGGIARWMAEFAKRADLVVSTGTLPDADDGAFPGGVDRLGFSSNLLKTLPGQLFWRSRVKALVKEHAPRFIWAGNVRPAGPVAAGTAARHRVPFGLMLHGGDLLRLAERQRRSRRRRRMVRGVLSTAAAVVANSRWTAELATEVAAEFGADLGDRLRVVPLGSDPTVFRPRADRAAILERFRLPPNFSWLLTVARLVPHKGIDRGIEVLGRLRHLYPELGYLVVGQGPDRPRLQALADQEGVADRVLFLTDVADSDLPAVHAMAAVYLGLSRQDGLEVEGFGISLVDAAASGVPVVAGQGGGTADAVLDGETGLLVPAADPAAIAAAVDSLLGDPERRAELGRAGRDWVERDRNWDRVARDLAAISRAAATAAPS
ncbi:MAG: glycosyltransferase family 4 protein [Gemmatimonadales bacterium]